MDMHAYAGAKLLYILPRPFGWAMSRQLPSHVSPDTMTDPVRTIMPTGSATLVYSVGTLECIMDGLRGVSTKPACRSLCQQISASAFE